MIITTTPTIENQIISEYKGIVFSEVISGVNALKDLAASFRDIFGGRTKAMKTNFCHCRCQNRRRNCRNWKYAHGCGNWNRCSDKLER